MAKYAFFFGGADLDKRIGNAEVAPKVHEQFLRWMDSLRDNGHFIAAHKLKDQTGARLTVRGGQVVEGPFMETKEAVGGVCFIEADSLEDAIELARSSPALVVQNGYVEVRVVDEDLPRDNV